MINLVVKLLPLSLLEKMYIGAGANLGEAISYIPIAGMPLRFNKIEKRFQTLEREYSRRGFKPIPQESFVSYGGYEIPINPLFIRQKAG